MKWKPDYKGSTREKTEAIILMQSHSEFCS